MANIDFPNNPQIDDTFTVDGKTYKWDGVKWVLLPLVSAQRTAIPTISFIDKTGNSIKVTFTNNEEEAVKVYYGLSTPPDLDTVVLNEAQTSSEIEFTNLDPETTYSIYAYSIVADPVSKKIKSEIVELEVTTLSLTEPPSLSFFSRTQATMTLALENNDSTTTNYYEIEGGETLFTSSSSLSPNQSVIVTLTGLIPNKAYNFVARAQAVGKPLSANSNTVSQSTLAQNQPNFSNVSSTSNSITFRVQNTNSDTTTIRYRLNADPTSGSLGVSLQPSFTSGNLTFSGLSPSTTYSIRARGDLNTNLGPVRSQNVTTQAPPPLFTQATGGTVNDYTQDGLNWRSHTFNSSGTFSVSQVGNAQGGGNQVDYLIIAGGGAGGGRTFNDRGTGGGGAGGYRTTLGTSGRSSSAESKVTISATNYTVTVGGGGAVPSDLQAGTNGSNSLALGITSIGGGGGAGRDNNSGHEARVGGSGGGGSGNAGNVRIGASGTSNQGWNGASGTSSGNLGGGGGGGAGSNGNPPNNATGGTGLNNTLRTGSNEIRGGGGAGAVAFSVTSGGAGGGGNGSGYSTAGSSGAANTGGGGGGTTRTVAANAGGSGIVIIRYRRP